MHSPNLHHGPVRASQSSDLPFRSTKASSTRSASRTSTIRPVQQFRSDPEVRAQFIARQQQRELRSRRKGASSSPEPITVFPQTAWNFPLPSSPSLSNSIPRAYIPDRPFPSSPRPWIRYHGNIAQQPRTVVHFDEAQLAMFAADNAARAARMNIKDELALAAGKVTPGIDDTPYIQYALQALDGPRGTSSLPHLASASSDAESDRLQPNRGIVADDMASRSATYAQPTPSDFVYDHDHGANRATESTPLHPFQPARHPSATFDPSITTSSRWVAVTKDMRKSIDPRSRSYQPLVFKPRILRPLYMTFLMLLCLLMTGALIFSAIFSDHRDGLTPYPGSIYSGQYFLFRILPQTLAGVIFIYAQCVVTTSRRILPFVSLAEENPEPRFMALFQELYPATFLLPQWTGPWQFRLFSAASWLAIFTIPLQSSAFACIFVETKWIWAPVQGVVWALVALYLILLLSTALLTVYWAGRWTGLIWDVRSVGDLLPLLNRSNAMTSFRQCELSASRADFRSQLHERWFDRLGYWRTEDMLTGGVWYTIGISSEESDAKDPHASMGRKASHDLSVDSADAAAAGFSDGARGKYRSWCLRDGPILAFAAVATTLLVALLIVSFLPQIRLESGFFAGVTARPNASVFSPANFIFSFVPSLIGMMLFLLFQSIDQALRIHQPWAELADGEGSPARKSLLADYAACLPLQATWKSARNGHWRVAAVSFAAVLFIFIPILAGGFLMALTGPDGKARMYPNMPVFSVLVAMLFLYVGGLLMMVPFRRQFLLPRPVTSIGDMMSLCSAEELGFDAAFRSVRSREDLEARLRVGRDNDTREESRWVLGIVPGRDEHRPSVRRLRRLTEKPMRFAGFMV